LCTRNLEFRSFTKLSHLLKLECRKLNSSSSYSTTKY